MLNGLLVAEGGEWPSGCAVLLEQVLSLLDQSVLEHAAGTLVDAIVESSAIRIETELQNAEAAQGIAALLPEFGHFLPRREANLDRADQLGDIIGMNLFSSSAVEVLKNSVEIVRTVACRAFAQALAQLFRTLGTREKSLE